MNNSLFRSDDTYEIAKAMHKEILAADDFEIAHQLNELVSRGLLVVERQGQTLIQDPANDKVRVVSAIRLVLKDKEYVNKLELENKKLKECLGIIQKAYVTINKEE